MYIKYQHLLLCIIININIMCARVGVSTCRLSENRETMYRLLIICNKIVKY